MTARRPSTVRVWLVLLVALALLDAFDYAVGAPTFNPLHPHAPHWVAGHAPRVRLRQVCTITIRRVDAATGTAGRPERTGCYSTVPGGQSIGAAGVNG